MLNPYQEKHFTISPPIKKDIGIYFAINKKYTSSKKGMIMNIGDKLIKLNLVDKNQIKLAAQNREQYKTLVRNGEYGLIALINGHIPYRKLKTLLSHIITRKYAGMVIMENLTPDQRMNVVKEKPKFRRSNNLLLIKDRYLPDYVAGHGGFGAVFHGTDIKTGRAVAIKTLISGDEKEEKRFEIEIKTLCSLDHPNILSICDYAREGYRTYLITEYLPGGTLKDRIEQNSTLPTPLLEKVIVQILDALDYLHKRGLFHRDIKPGNILFASENFVKLADFGLVKKENNDLQLTEVGRYIGTIGYIPTEIIRNTRPYAAESDIFSLGIVAYEALAGFNPFMKDTKEDTIKATIEENPPHIPSIPKGLSRAILKAIDKNPNKRYRSALEFKSAILNYDRCRTLEIRNPNLGVHKRRRFLPW